MKRTRKMESNDMADGSMVVWPKEYEKLLAEPKRKQRRTWVYDLPEDVRPLAIAKGWRTVADALRSYQHLERLLGQRAKPAMGERAA